MLCNDWFWYACLDNLEEVIDSRQILWLLPAQSNGSDNGKRAVSLIVLKMSGKKKISILLQKWVFGQDFVTE